MAGLSKSMAGIMRVLALVFAALAFAAPLAYADVGPTQPPPNVLVHMVKDGSPDASVSEITYHCMGDPSEDTGAVSQRAMSLSCSEGNCTNEGAWFYKFNPCFDFPGGYFTYDYGGETIKSGSFNFTSNYTKYELTIDSPSGDIKSSFGSSLPAGCCGSAFILAGIGAGALLVGRK